ncbi:MAG TPA: hypothetical protein VHO46_07805 [Bacteroidales bacterium]|nr:hypothetical protein [Bacteroidales bacterium]
MKKTALVTTVVLILLSYKANSQAITEVFADFHYYINDTLHSDNNGFGLTRAYLGYNYHPEGEFSGTLILNVCSPSDLAEGSKERRYAYFREASVTWTKDDLSMSFGMTTTRSLSFQQKFYGKRYVADNFEAINGYSTVADLGFTADYVINDFLKVDFTFMNGEGYNNLHIDNSIKSSFGVNIIPFEKGIMRLYADFDRPGGTWQQLYIGFIGYKSDLIMIGGEAAFKTNIDGTDSHDSWGFSSTGSIRVADKTEIFGRYDYTISNEISGESLPWNYMKDRQFFIAGAQYTFNDNFKLALDYQGNYPISGRVPPTRSVFLNTFFKF